MNDTKEQLAAYSKTVDKELDALLSWWKTYAVDHAQGGFYGEVTNRNKAIAEEPKGIVLNSRILWTFSAAYLLKANKEDLAIARRAFEYLSTYFYDSLNGGFYWSLYPNGEVLDGKKQIYGQAFAIYGLSEYYKASGDGKALEMAKETFTLIEKHSFDPVHLGYIEAFDQAWGGLRDLRLSDKDLNVEKSMNTHLHIIEAYANLYCCWKDEHLQKAIKQLLFVFKTHIIIDDRLSLFFASNWHPQSTLISYGHDIEAAWLLQECAESLGDLEEITLFKKIALAIAVAVQDGVDVDGGMYYEYDPVAGNTIREKHWWPQAEAMVGFFNAYQLSGDISFLHKSIKSWAYITANLKDKEHGEWFWGRYPDGELMKENKAGFWKCPYHNGRACLEIIRRINHSTILPQT
ncbi:AGE family epimerase/isomerase [Pedobacter insulae]|nr:AGE family epimerase/isomerase [Pedobacter insulae]